MWQRNNAKKGEKKNDQKWCDEGVITVYSKQMTIQLTKIIIEEQKGKW